MFCISPHCTIAMWTWYPEIQSNTERKKIWMDKLKVTPFSHCKKWRIPRCWGNARVLANLLHQGSFPQVRLASSVGRVTRGEDTFMEKDAAVDKVPSVCRRAFVFCCLECHDSERMTRSKIISGLGFFFRRDGNYAATLTQVKLCFY